MTISFDRVGVTAIADRLALATDVPTLEDSSIDSCGSATVAAAVASFIEATGSYQTRAAEAIVGLGATATASVDLLAGADTDSATQLGLLSSELITRQTGAPRAV